MTYKVNSPMVAHLWAHQKQDFATNGSNFYFQGKEIYSYGPHFRCASVETNKFGHKAYLVTTRTYSNATAKHIGMVRHAIPCGEFVFNTPRVVSLHGGKLSKVDYYEASAYIVDQVTIIGKCIQEQIKARSHDYRKEVETRLLEVGRWIEFWGLDKRQKSVEGAWLMPVLNKLSSTGKKDKEKYWNSTGESSGNLNLGSNKTDCQELFFDIVSRGLFQTTAIGGFEQRVLQLFIDRSGDPLLWEHFKERRERQAEINRLSKDRREQRYRRKEEERQRIAGMTLEEKIELWRSGALNSIWFCIPYNLKYNSLLRVCKGYVETSKGIRVDGVEAARLWKLVELFHNNEANFRHILAKDASNHQWSITSYRNDVMTAGCHRISYDEMRKAALQLGVAT